VRVLVTGAAGLYGVHLVDALVRRDDVEKVIGVDDLSRHFDCPDAFIPSPESERKFTLWRRDFRDLSAGDIDRWRVDVLVHLAAKVSIDESMERPGVYFAHNEQGTFGLTQTLLATRCRPTLLYASSPEVYGVPRRVPMDEDHPIYPRSVYAVTKLAAEKHGHALFEWYGYPVIVIRNFNTYGPNQNTAGHAAVIPALITAALLGSPLRVSGNGLQTRDFLYVKDAVAAYVAVLEKRERLAGGTFNIGTGRETTVLDLARTIAAMTGSRSRLMRAPQRSGDLPRLAADITRVRAATGWRPRLSLEQGLSDTIAWYAGVLGIEGGGRA
jgi:nucleoside-diphosphate-sugar epimerase